MRNYSLVGAGIQGRLIAAGRSPVWPKLTRVPRKACLLHHSTFEPFLSFTSTNSTRKNPKAYKVLNYRLANICTTKNLRAESKFVMSSDEAYGSFLERANQDTGASKEDSSSTAAINTKSVDTDVPQQLQNIEQYYTSEVDEPFEPVSLSWDGPELPSEGTKYPTIFCRCGLKILLFCLLPCGIRSWPRIISDDDDDEYEDEDDSNRYIIHQTSFRTSYSTILGF